VSLRGLQQAKKLPQLFVVFARLETEVYMILQKCSQTVKRYLLAPLVCSRKTEDFSMADGIADP